MIGINGAGVLTLLGGNGTPIPLELRGDFSALPAELQGGDDGDNDVHRAAIKARLTSSPGIAVRWNAFTSGPAIMERL
jgi:hypothetical protein